MFLQHLGDRTPSNAMIQMLELSLYSSVAPARVLLRHPHDQPANLLHDAWTANSLSRVRPLCGDEPAVPREDRVGRHDRGYLVQSLPSQRLSFGGQATTLIVGETQAPPVRLELFFQNAVLFDKVCDDGSLPTANPTGKRG